MKRDRAVKELVREYVDASAQREDFTPPAYGAVRRSIGASVLRTIANPFGNQKRQRKPLLLVASVVLLVAIGGITIAVEPVRAAIGHIVIRIVDAIGGVEKQHPAQYFIDLEDALFINERIENGKHLLHYQVGTATVFITVEDGDVQSDTWADETGERFTVANVPLASGTIDCFEHSEGCYTTIPKGDKTIAVIMVNGGKSQFAHVLQKLYERE